MNSAQYDCAIVGAGPAGMVLGLLLARRGLRTIVLEKHADFDRDFRGDTVHASTLEVMEQIGLAQRILDLPHEKLRKLQLHTPQGAIELADLGRLPSRYPYVAIMPQAHFLELLCDEAERYSNFTCLRGASVQSLLETQGRVNGVAFRHEQASHQLTANLVVGTDGRYSRLRKLSGLSAITNAPPMDVCWLRLPRDAKDGFVTGGFFVNQGRMLVCLPRQETWQLGYVFPKGDFAEVKQAGFPAFVDSLGATAPWLADRVTLLRGWEDVHFLNIQSDRLQRWFKPGLLLIGDAAHVMSPVGGVGINFAIADAVEAANVLANPSSPLLAAGPVPAHALALVQRKRMLATRLIQGFQSQVQRGIVQRALQGREFELPLLAKLLLATPGLRVLPLRLVGLGIPQAKLHL